jgi:hypothetical protein
MKKFPVRILRKIEQINSMLEEVKNADETPITYAGGTWPYYVDILPIEINNQFVTIRSAIKNHSFIDGKERYNVNKTSMFGDENCAKHLEYTLGIILKSFKKVISK